MTIHLIAEMVACSFGVKAEAILSRTKNPSASLPRFAVYWIARYRLNWSYGQIAKAIGRDRTTVLQGIQRIELKMLHYPDLVLMMNDALLLLGAEEVQKAA